MRILLDQGAPIALRQVLVGHVVHSAAYEGWDTLRNGDLLLAAEAAGFDLLVTTDKNLRYQQDLGSRRIAIVVLNNAQWPVLRHHTQLVAEVINSSNGRFLHRGCHTGLSCISLK